MKKVITIFLFVILLSVTALAMGGSGTVEDPYTIYDCTDLTNINLNLNANYKVMNAMSCGAFTSIGAFNGTLDGQRYAIDGLVMTGPLIGEISATALVQNVVLTNIDVDGAGGGLSGTHYGRIFNCSVQGAINTADGYAGGIAMRSRPGSVISYSDFQGSIISTATNFYSFTGGIVGEVYNANVSNCYVIGSILQPAGTMTGGLIGHVEAYSGGESYITNSYSQGYVVGGPSCAGSGQTAGGLIGTSLFTDVINCYSATEVTGACVIGGLIGNNWGSTPTMPIDSFWDVNLTLYGGGGNLGGGGSPKTTEEMQTQSTFTNWDFTNVWFINPAEYPGLRAYVPPACVPLWNCTQYGSCVNNLQSCTQVTDLNVCNVTYGGDYSEFQRSCGWTYQDNGTYAFGDGAFYVNYTIPTNTVASLSKLQVKFRNSTFPDPGVTYIQNVSVPTGCFRNNKLQFKWGIDPALEDYWVFGYCHNGTGWQNFKTLGWSDGGGDNNDAFYAYLIDGDWDTWSSLGGLYPPLWNYNTTEMGNFMKFYEESMWWSIGSGGGGGGGGGWPEPEQPPTEQTNETIAPPFLAVIPILDIPLELNFKGLYEQLIIMMQEIFAGDLGAIGRVAGSYWLELLITIAGISLVIMAGINISKPSKKRRRK